MQTLVVNLMQVVNLMFERACSTVTQMCQNYINEIFVAILEKLFPCQKDLVHIIGM